jgi:DNA-binding IclR family transcriptional regulator
LHTDENCVIVEGLIWEDQRVNVREIAEVTGIAKSTVQEIISDLNFHKVSVLSTTSHFSPDSSLVANVEVGSSAAFTL